MDAAAILKRARQALLSQAERDELEADLAERQANDREIPRNLGRKDLPVDRGELVYKRHGTPRDALTEAMQPQPTSLTDEWVRWIEQYVQSQLRDVRFEVG